MQTFFRDIRCAARQLRKSPGFTLTVVLALALGIGATTAIFSLVEGIVLRPLPFADSDRLVMLGDRIGNVKVLPVTAREIATYTTATTAFSSVGGFATAGYELSGGAIPQHIDGGRLNASVFTTLGVQPVLGRPFTSQEEDAHQLLAVISDPLWLNRFHRDPRVILAGYDKNRLGDLRDMIQRRNRQQKSAHFRIPLVAIFNAAKIPTVSLSTFQEADKV